MVYLKLEQLKKLVNSMESNNHDEVNILDNGQFLTRKSWHGYWEDVTSEIA